MRARFASAWNRTLLGVLSDGDKEIYKMFAALFILAMIFSAFFFAIRDYGRVTVIISFVAGFFTGALYILLIIGPLVLWIFLAVFLSHLLTGQENPANRALVVSAITSAIVVGVLWIVTTDFLKTVPILGDQLTFMFGDEDEDDD
jgi:hypothetical protein